MKEHALIYLGESKQHKHKIITLLQEYNFAYTFLDDNDLGQSILSLFDKNDETNDQNEMFHFNFIFFKDINHEAILSFYKDCATNNFAFSHKAVMTEHNKNWKLYDLLVEIASEHEFFVMYGQLHQVLKEANDMNPEEYTEASFAPYRQAFIEAFLYMKQEKLEKESMQQCIQKVLSTKENLNKK